MRREAGILDHVLKRPQTCSFVKNETGSTTAQSGCLGITSQEAMDRANWALQQGT